jgi:hypothetical protein
MMAMTAILPITLRLKATKTAGTATILMAMTRTTPAKAMGCPVAAIRITAAVEFPRTISLAAAGAEVAVVNPAIITVAVVKEVTRATMGVAKATIRRTSCKFDIEDHLQQR